MFKGIKSPLKPALESLNTPQALPTDSSLWETNTPYTYLDHTLVIEYLKGQDRVKKDWSYPVPDAYGHFTDVKGADGDELDCYLSTDFDPSASPVVVDQQDADTQKFDEHKVFLGYKDPKDAVSVYMQSFGDGKAPQRYAGSVTLSQSDFQEWISSGEVRDPISTAQSPNTVTPSGVTRIVLPDTGEAPIITVEDNPKGGKVYEIYILSIFNTDAWGSTTESILQILRSASDDDIVIFGISSYGGELDLATRISSAMRGSKAKIITMSLGPVASAGCLIWAEGQDRQISAGSTFMQHMSIQGIFGKTNLIAAATSASALYIKNVVYKRALEIGLFTEQELSDMADKGTDVFRSAKEIARRTGAELI